MSNAPDEERHDRALDRHLLRRLLGYLRPYRWQVALAILVGFVGTLVQLAGPYLTKQAIDHGIRHRDLPFLDQIAMLYLSVLAIGFFIGFLETQIMQRVGQRIMLDLRTALFARLQRLPVSYFDRNPVGRVMTRVTNDVDTLNELFTSGLVSFVGDFLTLIGIIIAMVQLNAELLGVTFSVIPLIVIATIAFRVVVRNSFREVRVALSRLNAFLNEHLSGMSTVQVLNREPRSFDEFQERNASHRDANLKTVAQHAVFFPVLELVGAIAISLIVWYGGRQVMWTGITLGTLVAFIQYTQRFFRPVSDMSEKYGILQQSMAAAERVFELLDAPEDPALAHPDAAGLRPERLRGHIEFENVWFAYQDEEWVLQDVSLEIRPGERVAIVGPTGSGKTTLVSLLLRYYAPQRGVIRVDGVPIERYDVRALRSRLGVVLQDVFLFSGTIEGNLSLGRSRLDREAMLAAAREVGAEPFITRLDGGYGAVVRERGATFSAGQRQLVSFARALAHDPDVLILDEATANVDSRTEEQLQRAVRRLLAGRTSLVIAHRLSTLQDVDRIVVVHHGRVRENGTHAELIALGGLYARLYQLQSLGAGRRAAERAPDEAPELLMRANRRTEMN
ncbi:MAG: ABC transporter ATP-binding protein [Candidatus Eisenbacteria bacterium]|uniref:ABC transporter ATP-binding protein n=1 Tax=Eiseniibacteriota bacterium TaxID=2212470 RepID=A0A849SJY2_UNCEI|nr:ABC transporter ATP-binding protein [Candidatus Eisenbacteria bacterium]